MGTTETLRALLAVRLSNLTDETTSPDRQKAVTRDHAQRLTGRAIPATPEASARAWLVLECGTLAADPAAGTLGFGVLETDADTVTARPVRVGVDGSFTLRGTRHRPPPPAPDDAPPSSHTED